MKAQITNTLIRFIWVIYIPTRGPSPALRSWIAALLEILRRCQWNVCTSILASSTFLPALPTEGCLAGQTA
jgi:hypothetical protein